jgi:hypothetical protein
MALWGNKDDIFSPGSVTVDYENLTITGSGTSFLAASVGDVISIGVGKTFGEAVIGEISSETLLSIVTADYLSGAPIVAVADYTISQKPKYTMGDSHYSADEIYGASENEVTVSTFLTHAGWVGVTTYLDNEGELRTKSEVLVAMSGITTGVTSYESAGDAEDDAVLPDAVITILTQPSSVGIATTELPQDAEFTVVASVVPTDTNLTYQWQEDSGSGFTNLVGETDSTLLLENTDDTNDGNEYRVVISVAGGDTTVTSETATLSIS